VVGKQFFFEKKNQKTFICFAYVLFVPAASSNGTKVFCFFFSKKKYFLASLVRDGGLDTIAKRVNADG